MEDYAVSAHASDAEKAAAAEYLKFFTSHDQDMKFWESSGKIPSTVEGQKAAYITGEDYAGFLQQIEDGCRPTLAFAKELEAFKLFFLEDSLWKGRNIWFFRTLWRGKINHSKSINRA